MKIKTTTLALLLFSSAASANDYVDHASAASWMIHGTDAKPVILNFCAQKPVAEQDQCINDNYLALPKLGLYFLLFNEITAQCAADNSHLGMDFVVQCVEDTGALDKLAADMMAKP